MHALAMPCNAVAYAPCSARLAFLKLKQRHRTPPVLSGKSVRLLVTAMTRAPAAMAALEAGAIALLSLTATCAARTSTTVSFLTMGLQLI